LLSSTQAGNFSKDVPFCVVESWRTAVRGVYYSVYGRRREIDPLRGEVLVDRAPSNGLDVRGISTP